MGRRLDDRPLVERRINKRESSTGAQMTAAPHGDHAVFVLLEADRGERRRTRVRVN